MKHIVVLATLFLLQACTAENTNKINEQSAISNVDSLNAKWIDGFNSRDADALTQLFVRNAVRLPNGSPAASGSEQIRQQYRSELEFLGDIELNASFHTEEVIVSNRLIIARGVLFSETFRRDAEEPLVNAGKWMAVVEQDLEGEWKYRWTMVNETRNSAE